MRRALVTATVAAGLLLALVASGAGATGSLPKVATQAPTGFGGPFVIRPSTIWFTGDSTGILGRIAKTVPAVGKRPGFLHWQTWTRRRAYAVGTEWYRSGGGGVFHRTSVTVALSDPRGGQFVKMTLHDDINGVATWCHPPGVAEWTLPSGPPGSTSCRGVRP